MGTSANKSDFVVESTAHGGLTVVCRDCAFSVFGRNLDRHEPTEENKAFLCGLGLAAVRCSRCRREVKV